MVAGMAFLISSDAISKHLTASHPVGQVICIRQMASLLFVVPFIWYRGGLAILRPHNVPLQIVRGLVFMISSFLIVTSLSLLPLPAVTAITFIGPIMVALLSAPVLGERVNARLWLATLLGFAGMLVIIRPGSAEFNWALLLPVGAAFGSAIRDMLVRILSRTDHSMSILFWSSLILTLGAACTAPFGWVEVAPAAWGWFLLGGAVNFCAHFLLIEAFRLGRAAVVAPFKYSSLIWSALLGFLIWGDVPGTALWAGAAILVVSGLWIARIEQKTN